jgi:hypothetical protein
VNQRALEAEVAALERWLDRNPIAQAVAQEDAASFKAPAPAAAASAHAPAKPRGTYVPPPADQGPYGDGECSYHGESYPRWGL